jgi:hyaluronoglucosaminidase
MRIRMTRVLWTLAATALMAALAVSASATSSAAAGPTTATPAALARPVVMAYITTTSAITPSRLTSKSGLTTINTATGATRTPIRVGADPEGVVVAPDGRTAYVADFPNAVSVIRTSTGAVIKTIRVPRQYGMVTVIGITPNGKTVYVCFGSNVVPILTANDKVLTPIRTNIGVTGMVFTPDSRTLYVNSWSGKIAVINTATNTMGRPIPLAGGLALAPDGGTLYVADGRALTPISTATDRAGQPIRFGVALKDVVISPDGRTAYVSQMPGMAGPGTVFPVDLVTGQILAPIKLAGGVTSLLLTPDGKTLLAVSQSAGSATLIRTATRSVLATVTVGGSPPSGSAITPDGRTAYVLGGRNAVIPISIATGKAGRAIKLIGFPTGLAFFRS